MKISALYRFTYIYLALPLFVFILSWLDYGFAALFSLLFAAAFYFAYPKVTEDAELFSHKSLVFLSVIAFIWCFLAGIGYFYYQSFDYHFRNAVFRDLINYDWAVYYNQANTPLVYYMAFWLVPAGMTKFLGLFIDNQYTLFMFGNVLLLIYATIGVTLLLAHLAMALKLQRGKQIALAVLMFIFFSGLDVIGHRYFLIVTQPFEYHFEWWATFIQYSSITTGMFWVFNQFIPVALLTLLIYNERKISNFGFLIALALFFSPYPAAGIGMFMMIYAGYCFCHSNNKKDFVCNEIFSLPNLVGVFWLLPLCVLYFITNSEGMDGWHYIFDFTTPQRFLLFVVLEFLLYVVILYPQYKRDVFFNVMFFSLLLIPFLRLDQQNNFCMRASIPAIVILALFVIRFFFEQHRLHRIKTGILFGIFLIGAMTPLVEFYRGIHYTVEAKKLALVKDEIYTLNGAYIPMPEFGWDVNHQYTAKTYRTDIFWRYIAKLRH
ncbi:MAG: hypothetical protein NC218_04160 [Acetobacter sp.]|nr:hypothetical protein [Acetobacter sp.]